MAGTKLDYDATGAQPLDTEAAKLTEEFALLPARFHAAAMAYTAACEAFLKADQEHDRMHGLRYLLLREELAAPKTVGTGKNAVERLRAPTGPELDAAVACDPDYLDARLARLEAEVAKIKARGVLDALDCRRECLVSLGAMRRQEIKTFGG